jgi:hypothetical protein
MKQSQNYLKEAFQALLAGDTDKRDDLCAKSKLAQEAELKAEAIAIILSIDFYVYADGTAIITKEMYAAAH